MTSTWASAPHGARAMRISPGEPAIPVDATPATGDLLWIDLDAAAPGVEVVAAEFGVSAETIENILTDPGHPDFDAQGNQIHLSLNSLTMNAAHQVDSAEFDLLIGDTWVMTVRHEPVPVVDWLWSEMLAGGVEHVEAPADVVSVLVLQGTRRYVPVVNTLATQADILGLDALSGSRGILADVQQLLRTEVVLRTALRAQRTALVGLVGHPNLTDAARERIADAEGLHRALEDDLLTTRTILTDALNAHYGAVAERTGEITRVLTVYAAVVLPMSLVAGIWGMNVDGLPFADGGFAAAMVVIGVVGLLSLVVFLRLRFLTIPERVATRGLVELLGEVVAIPVQTVRATRRLVGPTERPAPDVQNDRFEET